MLVSKACEHITQYTLNIWCYANALKQPSSQVNRALTSTHAKHVDRVVLAQWTDSVYYVNI